MKRNQRGVTLISLVVTIVVMLIIAGAAISTLGGDNGIITQSQKARVTSTQADVAEKIELACSAVSTNVMMKTSTDFSYNPQDHIDEYIESLKADLKDETVTDLGDKTSVTIGELSAGYNIFKTGNSIFIVYKDNTFALGVPTATTGYPVPTTATTSFPVDKQYAMLVGEIQVGTTSVSYVAPILTAN